VRTVSGCRVVQASIKVPAVPCKNCTAPIPAPKVAPAREKKVKKKKTAVGPPRMEQIAWVLKQQTAQTPIAKHGP